jgi:hypothetical protein
MDRIDPRQHRLPALRELSRAELQWLASYHEQRAARIQALAFERGAGGHSESRLRVARHAVAAETLRSVLAFIPEGSFLFLPRPEQGCDRPLAHESERT